MTFDDIRKKIGGNTLVSPDRLKVIYDLVSRTSHLDGYMAEVGVYKGGTSYLIAQTDPNRMLYSCDSFEGLPDADKSIDLHNKGDFNDVVYENVKQFLDLPNVRVIKGFFPNQELHKDMYDKEFSFVHLDVDLYKPTLECLEFFYTRMVKGAILVSDDYLWRNCPGVEKAFKEFLADKPEKLVDTGVLSCYFIKS